jgi:murein DD-endopeptidase MepM/ murein hydrolase activator NlpD
MPAKGQHRRTVKSHRLARTIAVAASGGAALALPLIGAAGAEAATPHAAKAGTKTYTVKAGDYLAKIAHDHKVKGGWKQLYKDNHDVIGDNPRLIKPGQKLVLNKAGKGAADAAKDEPGKAEAQPADAKPAKPAKPEPAKAATGYVAPVDNATPGTPYHQAGGMWSSGYHTGTDFVVPTGTPVHAIAAGTVVTADYSNAYGNEVVIKHADGKYSQYAHNSQLKVQVGQTVTAGQEISLSGATGNVTGPHVHFEIRTTPDYGSDVDPLAYLREHGVNVG